MHQLRADVAAMINTVAERDAVPIAARQADGVVELVGWHGGRLSDTGIDRPALPRRPMAAIRSPTACRDRAADRAAAVDGVERSIATGDHDRVRQAREAWAAEQRAEYEARAKAHALRSAAWSAEGELRAARRRERLVDAIERAKVRSTRALARGAKDRARGLAQTTIPRLKRELAAHDARHGAPAPQAPPPVHTSPDRTADMRGLREAAARGKRPDQAPVAVQAPPRADPAVELVAERETAAIAVEPVAVQAPPAVAAPEPVAVLPAGPAGPVDPVRQPYLQCLTFVRTIERFASEGPKLSQVAARAIAHADMVIESRGLTPTDPILQFRARAMDLRAAADPTARAAAVTGLIALLDPLRDASHKAGEFADPRVLRSTPASREADIKALQGQPLPMIGARIQATLYALTEAQASGDRRAAEECRAGLTLLNQRRTDLAQPRPRSHGKGVER